VNSPHGALQFHRRDLYFRKRALYGCARAGTKSTGMVVYGMTISVCFQKKETGTGTYAKSTEVVVNGSACGCRLCARVRCRCLQVPNESKVKVRKCVYVCNNDSSSHQQQ